VPQCLSACNPVTPWHRCTAVELFDAVDEPDDCRWALPMPGGTATWDKMRERCCVRVTARPSMQRVVLLIITLSITATFVPTMAHAGAGDVSPALREKAVAACRNDATRLCAGASSDESAMVACMRPKRALLTPRCRRVFDEVIKDVRR